VRLRAGQRILSMDSRHLMIFALAKLAESRNPETGAHLERIRAYCHVIAQDLSGQVKFSSQVDGEYVQTIYQTSPLHDIGKVGIPDSVLLNPGRLSDREWSIMKQHTIIGAETLRAVAREHAQAAFLDMAYEIALSHHECFDGSGYPHGLSGEQIPLSARIVSLADVYDALTTKRVYKDAFSHDVARAIILDGIGAHFDPDIVNSLLRNEEEFIGIRDRFADAALSRPREDVFAAATVD
jgi:putative two-component system response regulator